MHFGKLERTNGNWFFSHWLADFSDFYNMAQTKIPLCGGIKRLVFSRNKGQTIVHNILLSCNSASTPKSEELKRPKMASVCQSRQLKAVFLKLFPELAFKLIASVQTLHVIWVWNLNQICFQPHFSLLKMFPLLLIIVPCSIMWLNLYFKNASPSTTE